MKQELKKSGGEFSWIVVAFVITFPIFLILGALGGFDF